MCGKKLHVKIDDVHPEDALTMPKLSLACLLEVLKDDSFSKDYLFD